MQIASVNQAGPQGPKKSGASALTSKQQQEAEKKAFEIDKHNTEVQNKIFYYNLEVDELNTEPDEYDQDRQESLYWNIRQLSREPISVEMVNRLLTTIFQTNDVKATDDSEQKFQMIQEKFKFLHDLAKSCKLTTQELLKYSSRKVLSKITWLFMQDKTIICLVDAFISIKFFKEFVLPRSWFYLILENDITNEQIQNDILKSKWKDEKMVTESEIKKGLYECIAQTACSKKLNISQKRNMLQNIRNTFKFNSDEELAELFQSQISEDIFDGIGKPQKKYFHFESKVLICVMQKLGMSKKYLLEDILQQRDPDRVLVYYSKKQYINSEFFQRQQKTDEQGNKNKLVLEALEFLNKELKKNQTIQASDFPICFLEAFSLQFPFDEKNKSDQLFKQCSLMMFIRIVEIIFKNGLCENENFKNAIIYKVIYVLKLGTEDEDIVEMSIYSLQILLNAIGIKHTIKYLDRFFSIAVHAYLKYSNMRKIKNYTKRIFEFYIKDKLSYSQEQFKHLQFIFLSQIKNNAGMKDAVHCVHTELYSTEKKIADNLIVLVQGLKSASEDIRILSTRYILELLEDKDNSYNVRKVLVSNRVLKIVYLSIIDLKQDYQTEQNKEFSVLCGKVIAAIGLQHPFVNDTVNLKATNQKTQITQDQNQAINEERKFDINVKSDYFNPVTNLAGNKSSKKRDDTLENLAVPLLGSIKIERQEDIQLAIQIYKKIIEITNLSDDQPKNYFYSQFLLLKIIEAKTLQIQQKKNQGSDQEDENIQMMLANKIRYEVLSESVLRHINHDSKRYNELRHFGVQYKKKYQKQLQRFCFFMINLIEEPQWKEIFEACIPAIRQSHHITNAIMPYLIYYVLRFNQSDQELNITIAKYINDILKGDSQEQIDQILKALDFLNICLEQDKLIFKEFIEEQTKFRYVEKLFMLELDAKNTDANIISFIQTLGKFPHIRLSFLLVKKINKLKQEIDRDAKQAGAQKIKNYKRCIFNSEDNFRNLQNQPGNHGKSFLNILPQDQTIKVVNLYKKINPQDFDSEFFNNIAKTSSVMMTQSTDNNHAQLRDQGRKQYNQTKEKFKELMKQTNMIEELKNRNWIALRYWLGDFNLFDIESLFIMIQPENEYQIQQFEMTLCLIFAEYHKGLTELLRNDDTMDNRNYKDSLKKIQHLLRLLYHDFMLYLTEDKETSYNLKLFLHVIYEIDSSMHYMKDILFSQKEQISEIISRDVNKDKRKFEKIYYEFDMKLPFENLLTWFEERTQSNCPITSNQAIMMIYQVRKLIFSLYDRDNEQAYYLMKIAKIQRKISSDVLKVNQLFQECEKHKHRIIDFEYEYAKFILKQRNAHDSYKYIVSCMDEIKEKTDKMQKDTKVIWLPQRIYEKSVLLSIELQIKIDQRNPQILPQFSKFVKDLGKNKWEKPFFKFGLYLDMLDTPACGITQPIQTLNDEEKKKRLIQKIFYYIKSLEDGHKYIWQSLPRALQLWFEYKDDAADDSKIQIFMRQELQKLDNFKIASALQILLSRYGHPSPKVRETIQVVLSKVATAYPGQSSWWIFHFLYFDEKVQKQPKNTISRGDFAKELLNKVTAINKDVALKILEGEKIFFELKKLSEKQPAKNTDNQMDMPQNLQRISKSHLVMPIEENLSVQLPPKNYCKNYQLTSLVSTTKDISDFNKNNADIEDFIAKSAGHNNDAEDHKDNSNNQPGSEQSQFSAYKEDPVMLCSFQHKVTIMHSKEKPKKIGIIGSDGSNYNFLLKCDKYGDLRKEQRFIDFAVLCNKMLENDAEARKRNLRLRTYAIVPLSRNTGLIEWIQSTQTLKNVVGEYWKKNNIKGEMQDIKRKAQDAQKGDTHTQIWNQLKVDMKPVLGNWMADHFPSPEIWYEAKMNFIKSTAIWSIIGYIIGLGDRHGDNILIHSHTGEVTHVDFDCIFEKGAKLRVPEIVPFRLTSNIMDAFGIFSEKGVFVKSCEIVLKVLRKNNRNIQSFLSSFTNDPLIEANNNVKVEIKDGLETVKKKLNGQISSSEQGASATVEEQVDQVILNAINDESLKQMYIGWMPWL